MLEHIVARDIRTTTGNNLSVIHDLTSLDPWSCFGSQEKKILGEKLAEVPQQDWWRISYLEKLLTKRGEKHCSMGNRELAELIDSLCMIKNCTSWRLVKEEKQRMTRAMKS